MDCVYCAYCCDKVEVESGKKTAICPTCGKKFVSISDPKRQVRMIKKMAWRRNPAAQYRLGLCYRNGEGIEIDTVKAYNCFLVSAKNGNKNAQKELAICYETGQGVKVDLKKSAAWKRKSEAITPAEQSVVVGVFGKTTEIEAGLTSGKEDELLKDIAYSSGEEPLSAEEEQSFNDIEKEFASMFTQGEECEPYKNTEFPVEKESEEQNPSPMQEKSFTDSAREVEELFANQDMSQSQSSMFGDESPSRDVTQPMQAPLETIPDIKTVEMKYELAKLKLEMSELEKKVTTISNGIENLTKLIENS